MSAPMARMRQIDGERSVSSLVKVFVRKYAPMTYRSSSASYRGVTVRRIASPSRSSSNSIGAPPERWIAAVTSSRSKIVVSSIERTRSPGRRASAAGASGITSATWSIGVPYPQSTNSPIRSAPTRFAVGPARLIAARTYGGLL